MEQTQQISYSDLFPLKHIQDTCTNTEVLYEGFEKKSLHSLYKASSLSVTSPTLVFPIKQKRIKNKNKVKELYMISTYC